MLESIEESRECTITCWWAWLRCDLLCDMLVVGMVGLYGFDGLTRESGCFALGVQLGVSASATADFKEEMDLEVNILVELKGQKGKLIYTRRTG